MRKFKCKLVLEWQDDFDDDDWVKYNNEPIEEGIKQFRQWIEEDAIGHILASADNHLPSHYTSHYTIKEDKND